MDKKLKALKRNKAYWTERFQLLEESQHKDAMSVYRKIEPAFSRAQKDIQAEIEKWYARYADNNGISMVDARKQLNAKELEELKWDVNEYIKYGKENLIDGKWTKQLENASARFHISRLEALQLRTQEAYERAFGNEIDKVDDMLRALYQEGYYKSAYEIQKGIGIGWQVGQINLNKLEKLIRSPWAADGVNFSDRIWSYKGQMVNTLHQELTRTILQGKAPDMAVKSLERFVDSRVKSAKYRAYTLVQTEQAFISSASQKDAFVDMDVEQYEIVATLDSHTSEICQDLDGKVYDMKIFDPGSTAPPFHPRCRSTTVPYIDDGEGTRIARRLDTGEAEYVPGNMKYGEWRERFVDGGNNENIKPKNNVTTKKLEKEFQDITGGVSYEEMISDWGTLDNAYEGASGQDLIDLKRLKEIEKQLKKPAVPIREKAQIVKNFEKWGVDYNEVKPLQKPLSEKEIIDKISGGDLTEGSCGSLAYTYIGNKAGLDVLDFRGGKSRAYIAEKFTHKAVSELKGVVSETFTGKNGFAVCQKALESLEDGVEYCMGMGQHRAIIKKVDGINYFLELQEGSDSGFKRFEAKTLKERFGVQTARTLNKKVLEQEVIAIRIDSLYDNDDFRELLGYINTAKGSQLKGVSGYAK